ncbi:slit-robo rho gtpase-activating protein 3 [Limosa lapponica baueri]|uniref:Slit-robo rho gtpase-activating protein 3 n=1 Tax=Limosa lapponica baueri TaxID=1758121 RepID=A0A2I0T4D9_LIMLA|nr:slit-robo rho gtpase-activating protein 3 [Limosa lapponica baueri]
MGQGELGPALGSCVQEEVALTVAAEIRTQLVEQFKCLEQQSESRLQLLQDLQEFFRRKAEIELEYSRSLEKLAERFSSKIRSSREHQFK